MIGALLFVAATQADPLPGVWEGTSLCQLKPSACHDEHVIYRVGSTGARRYKINAYKLVGGQQLFMGAISLQLDSTSTQLDGPVIARNQLQARLHLEIKGTHMSGRMTLPDGRLFRLIEVDKH
jgi:hypothetical protein